MNTESGRLCPTPPFNFAQTLAFTRNFGPVKGEQALDSNSITKAIRVQGQTLVYRLSSSGSVEQPQLDYTLFSEQPVTEEIKTATLDRIAFFLSLYDDLHPFYQIGLQDPYLAPIIEQLYGYHQVKFPTPFETACWAIVSQRNTYTIAQKMKHRLTERYGSTLEVEGITYQAFPEPIQLAEADPTELYFMMPNLRRAEYIVAVAEAFSTADEQFLRTGPYEEVRKWLRGIKGIGEWSSIFIMLRGLGRVERFPPEEKWLFEAASKTYGHGQQVYPEELEQFAEPYGLWKGYWAHYLRVAA